RIEGADSAPADRFCPGCYSAARSSCGTAGPFPWGRTDVRSTRSGSMAELHLRSIGGGYDGDAIEGDEALARVPGRPIHVKYRSDIDGLRAIAVLSVVAFHAFPFWFKGGFAGV